MNLHILLLLLYLPTIGFRWTKKAIVHHHSDFYGKKGKKEDLKLHSLQFFNTVHHDA